jgi:hypothetical protein
MHHEFKEIAQMAAMGFVLPVLPGKKAQWVEFHEALSGSRRSEWEACLRRIGVARHSVHLQETPQGEMVVVYVEADDLPRAFGELGTSQGAFEVWFRQQALETEGIDLTKGLEAPPTPIYDFKL